MIVGDGDIASALKDRKELLFFASGVSKSKEKKQSEYQREIDLLFKQDKSKHLVYFSSLCIFYSKSRYAKHKVHMEELVKKNFNRYTIIRMGNITWGKNPYTLINYLRIHPEAEIRDEWRYICDKKEFLHWINLIPKWNCEMNLPGKRLKVVDIVSKFIKKEENN